MFWSCKLANLFNCIIYITVCNSSHTKKAYKNLMFVPELQILVSQLKNRVQNLF